MMPCNKYYNPLLAQIHHQDYGQLARKAAEVMQQLIEKAQWSTARIVDLGCGSGITAAILSEQGHGVTGVDYSGDMLALARKNAPQAKFIQASLFDYELPTCDLISAIGEPLNYLFDERSSVDELSGLFRKIFRALTPGGYFVFDLLAPETLADENPQKRIVETEAYTMFLQVTEDPVQNVLTREITVFLREGDLYRREKETHRQRLYAPDWVTAALERVGFQVDVLRHYADLALRREHYAYVCWKPQGK